jgi:hypothetical protein
MPLVDQGKVTATCPSGKQVVSGGYSATVPVMITANRPEGLGSEWAVTAEAQGSFALTVYAICVDGQ